jgi:hypothetical protein
MGRGRLPLRIQETTYCNILGSANSHLSDLDGDEGHPQQIKVPEELLAKLLRRYLRVECSSWILTFPGTLATRPAGRTHLGSLLNRAMLPFLWPDATHRLARAGTRLQKSWRYFPVREAWHSSLSGTHRSGDGLLGGFAFTYDPRRTFTVESEVSYRAPLA